MSGPEHKGLYATRDTDEEQAICRACSLAHCIDLRPGCPLYDRRRGEALAAMAEGRPGGRRAQRRQQQAVPC